jgi:kynurenine formamidase
VISVPSLYYSQACLNTAARLDREFISCGRQPDGHDRERVRGPVDASATAHGAATGGTGTGAPGTERPATNDGEGGVGVRQYDLSRPVGPETWTYPADPDVSVEAAATVEEDGYRVTHVSMGTHAGTHLDAPAHTEPGGRTVDDYRPSAFRFDAVRLDVSGTAPREPIDRATIRDAATAVCPDEAFAADTFILRTGWDEYWGSDWYQEHPFLAPSAAAWLADTGYHVGIDAPSVDPTPSPNARPDEPDGVPAHHALLGEGQFVVENLTGLATPPDCFRVHAYPLAIQGAEAAPVRAVAAVEE